MSWIRSKSRSIAPALLCLLAASLAPRMGLYSHRHAAADHGHVHAWDGARLAGLSVLLAYLRQAHDAAGHDHDHGWSGHTHGRSDHDRGAHRKSDRVHHRSGDARATRERVDRNPTLVARSGAPHSHWQAPFQSAVSTALPVLDVRAIALRQPRAPRAGRVQRDPVTLRARAPPRIAPTPSE